MQNKKLAFVNADYEGQVVDGLPDGVGKMTYHNGDVCVGMWKNGKINGTATYEHFASDEKYIGEFDDSEMSGKGSYFFADGSTYEGQWKNNKQNGHGIFTDAEGNVHNGMWKDAAQNGEGVFVFKNENWYVEGFWINGQLNGDGVVTYEDGSKKHVVFENGKVVQDNSLTEENKNEFIS